MNDRNPAGTYAPPGRRGKRGGRADDISWAAVRKRRGAADGGAGRLGYPGRHGRGCVARVRPGEAREEDKHGRCVTGVREATGGGGRRHDEAGGATGRVGGTGGQEDS